MITPEDVQKRLDTSPRSFLASLAWHLAIGARGGYVAAGNEPPDAANLLQGHNEVLVVILEQLRSLDLEKPAYPNDVLLPVLIETAQHGDCSGNLGWAINQAMGEG